MSKQKEYDPDKMSQLFVELTDDLAYARTHYPKRSVKVYLNSLAQKIFHDLYRKKREPLSRFIRFWTIDLPLEMYSARYSLLVAFSIFVVGLFIGIVSTNDDANFLGAVVGYDYVAMAEANIEMGKPMDVYGSGSEIMSFTQIALNNLRVALITFVLGIFFSIGSAVFLFFNSIMVGAFQWFYVVRGLTLTSFLTIWIHGAFEIPAIILAAAAGITMGNSYLFPGTLSRVQSLVIGAKRGVKIMIGIIPFIVLAAFIEGFATRHTVIATSGEALASEWPNSVKWIFILSCFVIVLGYFVIYPFFVARKHNFDGKVVVKPQFKIKKKIELFKIKEVGEIFTDTFVIYKKIIPTFLKFILITIPINIGYVYLLFSRVTFFEYQEKVHSEYSWNIASSIFGRVEKIFSNLEVLFVWNNYYDTLLFWIQVLVFAFNTLNVFYIFKVIFKKEPPITFKNYFLFFIKHFWKLIILFSLFGVISCFVPFVLLLLLALITPFLYMMMVPPILKGGNFFKHLGEGFTKGGKAYGSALGVFFSLLVTLSVVYVFIGVPLDMFKDMILEWFVLPLSNEPKYILTFIDASLYLTFCHLLFPLFHIGFCFLYYSVTEKEEAIGLFERLKHFGQKDKRYESFENELV